MKRLRVQASNNFIQNIIFSSAPSNKYIKTMYVSMQRIVERNDFFVCKRKKRSGGGVRGGEEGGIISMKIIQIYHDINVINARRKKEEKEREREREEKPKKMCRRMMMQGIGKNDYNTNNSPKFDDTEKTRETKTKNLTKIWIEKERSRSLVDLERERIINKLI